MKKILTAAAMVMGAYLAAGDAPVTAYRCGESLLVQSSYSDRWDIVIRTWRAANEEAFLIPRNSDMLQHIPLKKINFDSNRCVCRFISKDAVLLHCNSDEYPATLFGGYKFLSGNHGSAFGRYLTIPSHGLSTADIGGGITDEKGRKFIIVQITDKDRILIHPEPLDDSPVGRAVFFHMGSEKLKYKGKDLPYLKAAMGQIRPLNRVWRNEFLIDGRTPLPDKTVVRCSFVDHVFVHDVIAPEAVIALIKKNPGRKPVPEFHANHQMLKVDDSPELAEYRELPALLGISNRFRHQQRGCMVNYRTTTVKSNFQWVSQMDVMFGWCGAFTPRRQEYFYVPKMKKIMLKNRHTGKPEYECDLSAKYLMPVNWQVDYIVDRQKDCLDPDNPPDRFIRVSGDDKPMFGVVLGYSLTDGCTALVNRGAHRSKVYYLYHTKKMYPFCYTLNDPAPGTQMTSVSYKHYFDPAAEPDATSFYYHWENDSLMVYFDTHKALKNKTLALPSWCAGKKITVVEKTQSVEFTGSTDKVPESGIVFNVNGSYGYLVLKLD